MVRRRSPNVVPESGRVVGRHDDAVYEQAHIDDSRRVLSVGRDATLRVWDVAAGTLERQWQLDAPANAVSEDAGLAATCTRNGTVVVVSTDSDGLAAEWACPAPETVLLTGDGATALTGGGDGVVRWWDVGRRSELGSVDLDPGGAVVSLCLSPDGTTIAASTQSSGAVFLDAATGAVRLATLPDYGADVNVVDCIYLDDQSCAATLHARHEGPIGTTADPDIYEIAVWQPALGEPALDRTLLGHTNWIAGLGVSASGSLLASASMDTTVGLWDPPQSLRFLRGHRDAVYAVCFTSDGETLLTASADRTIRAWRIEDELQRPVDRRPFSLEESVRRVQANVRIADPAHVVARDIAEALLALETPAELEDAFAELVELNSPQWLPTLRALNQTVTVLREQAQRSGDAATALRCARIDAMAQDSLRRQVLSARRPRDEPVAYDVPQGSGEGAGALAQAFRAAVATGDTGALSASVSRRLPADDLLLGLAVIQAEVWPPILSGHLDPRRVAPAAKLLATAEADDPAVRIALFDLAGRMLGIAQWNDDAIDVLERGVEAARSVESARDEASFLGNLANAYRNAGRLVEAERAYEQVIDMSPESEILANHLANLAIVHSDRGELGKAAARAEDALAVAKATDDERVRIQISVNLAGYYEQLGDHERAIRLLEGTAEQAAAIGADALAGQATGNLAQSLGSVGRLEEARTRYEQALLTAREVGEAGQLVHVVAGLGDVEDRLGERDEAARHLAEAAAIAGENGLGRRRFRALLRLSAVLDEAQATAVLEEAAALGESLRVQPFGAAVAGGLHRAHARLLASRVAANDPAGAFAWAERSRVAALAEVGAVPLGTGAVTRELRRLGEGTRLVSWFDAGDRLYVFVVDGSLDTVSVDVEPLREELDRAAELVRQELAEDAAVGETWDQQAAIAFRAAAPRLEGARLVVLAPHGRLFNLPLHAVRLGGSRLIERWPVAYVPAASALPRLLDGADPPRAAGVVGALFVREAERVAETLGVDASLVGESVPKEQVLALLRDRDLVHVSSHGFFSPLEPSFSGWILDPSPGVLDYLHARQKRDFERAYEDVLTVSMNEEAARATILSASDLDAARPAPRHVTMSACETGIVAVGPTDDPAGLVPALLRAGTRSILATLWRVDPDATETMMLEFYRRLGRGDGWAHRPEILRDIVLEAMRERPGNPHDWAPFVLIGGLVEKAC